MTSNPMALTGINKKTSLNSDKMTNEFNLKDSGVPDEFNSDTLKIVKDSEINKLGSSSSCCSGGCESGLHCHLCPDQTINGRSLQPERPLLDDVIVSGSPHSSPRIVIHKDPLLNAGHKESLKSNCSFNSIDQALFSCRASSRIEKPTKMDSEGFGSFDMTTIRKGKTSELDKERCLPDYCSGGCGYQAINEQSKKPKNKQSENENRSHSAKIYASPPSKLQNPDDLFSSTFQDVDTDGILKSDSQRIEYDQFGKIKAAPRKLQFHPYKKVDVENQKNSESPNPIASTEEVPKEIDEYFFGAKSVENDFDWTYMKSFRQLYEEDRWEGYPSSPSFAIHGDPANSEHLEPFNTNYVPNPTCQGSSSFVGLMEEDGSMNSGRFGNFDTEALSIQNASEYSSGDGEDDLHCLLSQNPIINRQSNKPKRNQLNNSHWFNDARVNASPSPKLQNPDDSSSSTSEEVNTDSMLVDNESSRRKIKATPNKLQFHPYKKVDVENQKNPHSPQSINSPEEEQKGIDEFLFGAESVGKEFDWTYMKSFKQIYEDDRWATHNYEIGKGNSRPTSPSFD